MFYALKSKGVCSSKQEFWFEMDLIDLEQAGAFVPREVWDEFIIIKKEQIVMTPTDYTRR